MGATKMINQNKPIVFSSNNSELTMSSREIAELTGTRHDSVKRAIERLSDKGIIVQPPMVGEQILDKLSRPRTEKSYLFSGVQGKRDSIIVVAQLYPEFTARLVDRWQELENKSIPTTLPEALRLAADMAEKIALDAPKVEFAELIGEADGVLIGNYAKSVGIGQNKLFSWLRENKILNSMDCKHNTPRDEYIHRGYFTCKAVAINTNHGIKEKFTTHITGKGQFWLTGKLRNNGFI